MCIRDRVNMKYFTKLILSFLVFFSALNVQAQTATVTFRVDMQNVTDAFTTPEVNGTFNSWCGNCWAMSDADGDNIWDVTGTIDINTDYEYKFSADTWTIQENLFAGDPCTNDGSTGNVNRTLNVSGDTDLGVVCWNSCDDCSVAPSHYSVTFEVDMSTCTDAFTTPEVNSTLNNWCGNCWPMTDADGDNVWQHTALVASGATPEYKFSADGWAIQESLDPTLGCAEFITTSDNTGTFTNRQVTITQDETFSAPYNGCNLVPPPTSLISDCNDFISGPNAWPYVLVATTISDGVSSQGAQTFTMNVTSLPSNGANVRVYKTTANGNDFFGSPVALTLGSNSITVSAVSFDRTVKFQFSDGSVEFDALNLNGVDSDCLLPPPPTSLISDCNDFVSGPNAWPYVLVAATVSDGVSSQGAQTFTMNVTTLPSGGANFRVFKTTANGGNFFGNPVAMTLGSNSITVSAVSFDRAVKFQFSDGSVELDDLS